MRRRLRAGAQTEDLRTAGPFYYDVAEALVRVGAMLLLCRQLMSQC
jgi:hypothetical protein